VGLSAANKTHEQDARVAGGKADIQTGQLLTIKRSLCPSVITDVSTSEFSTIVLSFIQSYNMNPLNSCKLTVDYLFMLQLAFL
jgi:hypothetical protein